MKKLLCLAALAVFTQLSLAEMSISPWVPIYKGIDHSVGTNIADANLPRVQSVNCVRIDLQDPDVQLMTTPRINGWTLETKETGSEYVSNFLVLNNLKVATDCNFYDVYPGGSDASTSGLPCQVYGLSVCTGQVVSLPDGHGRYASLLFTTNKVPYWNFTNRYGVGTNAMNAYTNVPGIYTAVSGAYPVLTNGVILDAATLYAWAPEPGLHGAEPRTIFGVSQDRRYLFLMIIDGRQGTNQFVIPAYSDGATDQDSALWMLAFGAWDAINMDGGNSTCLYKQDCAGNPTALGHSSRVASRGRERIIGSHFGVYAQPLPGFINNVYAIPGADTALINWTTASNATSQVEYGLTTAYGNITAEDPTLTTNHAIILTGLTPGKRYYYQVISRTGTQEYRSACGGPFTTTNPPSTILFGVTNRWSYSVSNLDLVSWKAPDYIDQYWDIGPGPLWCDYRAAYPIGHPDIQFLRPTNGTKMPTNELTARPYTTYYFRTYFEFPMDPTGVTLTFTNYVDDGAAWYLNGKPIHRIYLPDPAYNNSPSLGWPCASGNANCAYVFTLSGDEMTNVVQGENCLAVEVHNSTLNSPDVTFACTLSYFAPPPPVPFFYGINITRGMSNAAIAWQTLSNATSQVLYGLTPELGSSTPLDPNLVGNHLVELSDLQPGSTYYYQIIATFDTNQYVTNGAFTTIPLPPPPFFTNLVVNAYSYAATISWQTISNSSSQVEYGLTPTLGSFTPLDNNLVTNHLVTLSNLVPSTNYYFRVISSLNSTTFSTNGAFTTLPAPLFNVSVIPGLTSATISWMTLSNTTTQVRYGLTPDLPEATPIIPTLVTNHIAFLNGLMEATNYYFMVVSTVGTTQYNATGTFNTSFGTLVPLTKGWKFNTTNWDGSAWQGRSFPDETWGNGTALLWADSRPIGSTLVQPKNSRMGVSYPSGYPFLTYYFRTHFTNQTSMPGYTLLFSNVVDDGAVFYLNGAELFRVRMPAAPNLITNGSFATGQPIGGDPTNAELVRVWGDKLTNIVVGDNLLAVEVHNVSAGNPDVIFGTSLGWVRALTSETRLRVALSNDVPHISWDTKGLTLQHADFLATNAWSDVPGPAISPYRVPNPGTHKFYRLRN